MNRRRRSIQALLFVVCVAIPLSLRGESATAQAQSQASSAPGQNPQLNPVIQFERTGGFAGIAQSFKIYEDGRVVNIAGRTQRISPKTVAAFRRRLEAIDPSADSAFKDPKNLCFDCFHYRIAIAGSYGVRSFDLVEPALTSAGNLPKVTRDLRDYLTKLKWR